MLNSEVGQNFIQWLVERNQGDRTNPVMVLMHLVVEEGSYKKGHRMNGKMDIFCLSLDLKFLLWRKKRWERKKPRWSIHVHFAFQMTNILPLIFKCPKPPVYFFKVILNIYGA